MKVVRIDSRLRDLPSAEQIGAKAANLARMAMLGLPVPPAFVLPVSLCADVAAEKAHSIQHLIEGLREGIAFLEEATGKTFDDSCNPLLVSVRSGAARSMPGMLDTVLNVGCTSKAVRGLIRSLGKPRLAWDCRRRLIESYAETVLGIDTELFAARLQEFFDKEGVETERDFDSEAIERLAASEQGIVAEYDDGWLENANAQLDHSAKAVCRSWMSERAQTYRRIQKLDFLEGTAVTVQAMVFGNGGPSSGAGVAFSRDPSTGVPQPVIDILFDAQGEDVVSGRRTPGTEATLARAFPGVAAELRSILHRLEAEFRDVQDIEFTVEDGKLWILQARSAKRTPRAALRIAIDLVHEGLITSEEAVARLADLDLADLVETTLVSAQPPIAVGVGASNGIAMGRVAFDSDEAQRLSSAGEAAILMRPDTSTADIAGFAASAGIVTAVGGRTAHASLVARQMGKPCVVGCREMAIDAMARCARVSETIISAGDWITVDGNEGCVYSGQCEIVARRPESELAELAAWKAGAPSSP